MSESETPAGLLANFSAGARKARAWLKADKSERQSLREVFTDPEPEEVTLAELLDEAEVVDSAYIDISRLTNPLERAAKRPHSA